MIPDITQVLASFTQPIDIPTDPKSILWMFPLLLAIATVYKATKILVMSWSKFGKQVVILFCTISLFMVFLGVALILLVKVITE
jgi:hypothetical protein